MGAFLSQLIDARERWLNGKSAVAATLWCAMNLVALAVFLRWLAGAVTTGPPTGVMCATATLTALAGLSAYALFHQLDYRGEHWSWGALPVFLTLFPLIVALTVMPREAATSTWFVGSLGFLCAAVLFVSETKFRRQRHVAEKAPTVNDQDVDSEIDSQLEQRLSQTIGLQDNLDTETAETPWQDNDVSQWMTRRVHADGNIAVEGVTVAEFAAGQNRTSVHLAFCPALPRTPKIQCEPVDDADVRIKVAAVYPHGVRLDLTRPSHDRAAQHITIGYFAHVPIKKTADAAA